MPGLLRVLAVGRSWRSRLARGATVLPRGGSWVAPTFGLCPPLALYNTTESVAPGLYLYAHDARSVAPTRGDYHYPVRSSAPYQAPRGDAAGRGRRWRAGRRGSASTSSGWGTCSATRTGAPRCGATRRGSSSP